MRRPSQQQSQSQQQQQQLPLAIHLYSTHFTLQDGDTAYKYSGPLKCIIDAINRLEIPAEAIDLLPQSCFVQGAAVIDVYDHRFGTAGAAAFAAAAAAASSGHSTTTSDLKHALLKQSVPIPSLHSTEPSSTAPSANSSTATNLAADAVKPIRIMLHHSAKSLLHDIVHFGNQFSTAEKSVWTEDATTELYAKLLPIVEEPLKLDPDIHILRQTTLDAYNRRKLIYERVKKRVADTVERQERESAAQEIGRLMLMMDKDCEFFPQYRQLSFVEQWRNKRRAADSEPLLGLEDRGKVKPGANGRLLFNQNRRIVRTLRYRQTIQNRIIHTILNIYDAGGGRYDGVLRWGDEEGTSLGPGGGTLYFEIGNKGAVEYYVGHFKGFYGIDHKLVNDSVPADSSTLASAAAAAAAAASVGGIPNLAAFMPGFDLASVAGTSTAPGSTLLQPNMQSPSMAHDAMNLSTPSNAANPAVMAGTATGTATAPTGPPLISLNMQQLQHLQHLQFQQQQQMQQLQQLQQLQQQLQQTGQQQQTPLNSNVFNAQQLTAQQKWLTQQQMMAALAQSQQAVLARSQQQQQQHLGHIGLQQSVNSAMSPPVVNVTTPSGQPGQ